VTIVRIVLADPRSGRVPEGSTVNRRQLIVLADDAGHRAVPLWLRVIDAKLLWGLLERSAGDAVMDGVLEETAARLLHAAGVGVTAVDIEPAGEDVPELRSDTAAARVALATAAGDRHVTVSAGYGLKLAVAAGAPVRVADAVWTGARSRSTARTCMRRSCSRRPTERGAVPGSGGVSSRGTWRSPTAWHRAGLPRPVVFTRRLPGWLRRSSRAAFRPGEPARRQRAGASTMRSRCRGRPLQG
jgi:hypothetical protein